MRTQRPYLQCPGLPGCNELSLSCFPRSGAQTKLGDFDFWIRHRPNSVLFYIGRSNNSSLTFETPTNGRQGRGNKSGEGRTVLIGIMTRNILIADTFLTPTTPTKAHHLRARHCLWRQSVSRARHLTGSVLTPVKCLSEKIKQVGNENITSNSIRHYKAGRWNSE